MNQPQKAIEWDASLVTGVREIDDDHVELINIYNNLFAACYSSVGATVVDTALRRMADYTQHHFEREEKLMRLHIYPGYTVHKDQHDQLMKTTLNIRERSSSTTALEISNETLLFLREWIIKHIMQHDKAFANFIKTRPQGMFPSA